MEEMYAPSLNANDVEAILGAPVFDKELYEDNEHAGVVTGLAWTAVGGDILFIESSLSPGKGKLTLTGNLGEVMKESAMIAMAYLKANAAKFGIDPRIFVHWDIQLKIQADAIPK